jgi:dipeptidyl aminopeptidase/acylaminoacyl peptidase
MGSIPQGSGCVWASAGGASLAALAALSAPETDVRAVVAAYPPVDFYQTGEKSEEPKSYESRFPGAPIRSVPELVRQADPATYARPGAPPFLLVHGEGDTSVAVAQSRLIYDALRAHENTVTLSTIEGLEHGFLNDNAFDRGPPLRHRKRAWRTGETENVYEAPPFTFGVMETFFRRYL